MMDTILNLGLNDEVAEGMVRKTGNPHFVYDSYLPLCSDVRRRGAGNETGE